MAQYGNFPPDIAIQTQNNLITGPTEGGVISINAGDATKFDLTEGAGYIIDNVTDPDNPVNDRITWATQTVTPGDLEGRTTSIVCIDINGNVVLKDLADMPTFLRDNIVLGSITHPTSSTITGVSNIVLSGGAVSPQLSLADLSFALGAIKRRGHKVSGVSAALNIQIAQGETYFLGSNFKNSLTNPNYFTTAAQNPATFIYTWRDGSGGFNFSAPTTTINPDAWDDDSGGASEPGGSLLPVRWQVQRVFLGIAGVGIHYGQEQYLSANDATLGILTEDFEGAPGLVDGSLFLGWILMRANHTDATDFIFIQANKTGGAGGDLGIIDT